MWRYAGGAARVADETYRRPEGGKPNGGSAMLVLTRKTGQSIMIGDDIEVSVLAVSRDKIRIGITAPKEVPVFRKEVWISIKEGDAPEKGTDTPASQNGI